MDAGTRSIIDGVQAWEGGGLLETVLPSVKDKPPASLHDAAGKRFDAPVTLAQLRELLAGAPDARLVAGSTDLALEITQQLKTLPHLVSTEQVPELQLIEETDNGLCIGAAVSYRRAGKALSERWPAFGPMLERLGSLQIRNRGTLGGNIGNASPIADMPPPLIALGAQIQLDSAAGTRWIALEDFFLDYRKTALRSGEFIRTVRVKEIGANEHLFIYKVSKRLDDDISAVLGAFWFHFDGAQIIDCRLAYGGMAATPKRARAAETVLRGATFDDASISRAIAALASDFTPMSDVRASAAYRAQVAGNLLRRALLEYSVGADSPYGLMVTDYA
jgi:xanthine dehydrogenase small subunit